MAMRWTLLRGLAREQRHWGPFVELLRARLPGHEVQCLDLAGTGTEHAQTSPASIAGIAADVRRRWLSRPFAGPQALLGMSLGGMVAMEWCSAHPGDFARAVLVNTSAADLSAPWRRMSLPAMPGVVRALFSRDEVGRQRRILGLTTKLAGGLDALAADFARVQADAPIRRGTVLRQLFAASRFRAPARLDLPLLVLAGGRDPFTDPECPRRVAERFLARLEVHPQAGHDLPLDAPEWLADRVAAFSMQ